MKLITALAPLTLLLALPACIPKAFIYKQEDRLDKAHTERDLVTLRQMCWKPGELWRNSDGDAARAAKAIQTARAAIGQAGIKERLSVSLAGGGLADEVVGQIRKDGIGVGLELVKAGDYSFSLDLSAPACKVGDERVTVKTSHEEQRGTKVSAE